MHEGRHFSKNPIEIHALTEHNPALIVIDEELCREGGLVKFLCHE